MNSRPCFASICFCPQVYSEALLVSIFSTYVNLFHFIFRKVTLHLRIKLTEFF